MITKIRAQAKIDNFAFKNSNIIIEGLIWKRKDYFLWKKIETQKNNVIIKFYFCPNLFSYLNKIFINKLLHLIIINSISKIENGYIAENLFPKKMNCDLLESHHFLNLARSDKKIILGKNKI